MSCAQQPEEGVWIATDTSNGITRAILRYNCQDLVLNGEPYPPGPPWYVHLWGKCSPSDCDWGEVAGRRLDNGVIYSTYEHGFARRGIHMQSVSSGELWMYVYTQFTDGSGRPDYEMELFMRPESGSLRRGAASDELAAFRNGEIRTKQARTSMSVDANPRSYDAKLSERGSPRPLPRPPAMR